MSESRKAAEQVTPTIDHRTTDAGHDGSDTSVDRQQTVHVSHPVTTEDRPLGHWGLAKRGFDVVLSATGLLLVSPVLIVVAVIVKCTSSGPVFFRQERMGRNFRPFRINKFRTMVQDAPKQGSQITAGRDPRITALATFSDEQSLMNCRSCGTCS